MRRALCIVALMGAPLLAQQAGPPRWPMFRRHALDAGAHESAAVADVNRDGRLDIIAGASWYEAPGWKKHPMREIPFSNGYIDDFSNFALDCNGDGYPDVIAASWFSKKLSWYENPGAAGAGDPMWKEHPIETGFNYELILLADVDGDGRAEEIVPNYGNSPEIVWFKRRGSTGDWERKVVGRVPEVNGLHGVGAGDVNGDGRPDVITPLGWFEAPSWTFHGEFRLLRPRSQASPIYVLDCNGDGRRDLVYGSGHDYGVFWLENRGGGSWSEHCIDDSWSQAHAATLADLDHDGRPDIVTGKRYLAHDTDPGAYEPLGLYWYRSDGAGHFVKHVIDFGTKAGGGMQIPVLDIDRDGDLDIVVAGKSGLFLFEQVEMEREKKR
jgi:hypothetical protein